MPLSYHVLDDGHQSRTCPLVTMFSMMGTNRVRVALRCSLAHVHSFTHHTTPPFSFSASFSFSVYLAMFPSVLVGVCVCLWLSHLPVPARLPSACFFLCGCELACVLVCVLVFIRIPPRSSSLAFTLLQ